MTSTNGAHKGKPGDNVVSPEDIKKDEIPSEKD